MTKVSSIAIKLKSSSGTFSSIAIELNIEGQRALDICIEMKLYRFLIIAFLSTLYIILVFK